MSSLLMTLERYFSTVFGLTHKYLLPGWWNYLQLLTETPAILFRREGRSHEQQAFLLGSTDKRPFDYREGPHCGA